MENRYVFNPFRQHHNGIDGFKDWEDRSKISARAFAGAFQAGDTAKVLSFVFDRLYVLRNQLVHGGATWNSGINRAQVRDGAAILTFLMPVFLDLMMENPQAGWGKPFYPVVARNLALDPNFMLRGGKHLGMGPRSVIFAQGPLNQRAGLKNHALHRSKFLF